MKGKQAPKISIGISLIAVLLLLIVVMATLPGASATTTIVQPSSADSYLDAGHQDDNFGEKDIISVYSGGPTPTAVPLIKTVGLLKSENRGIIEFELSKIPAGAHIQNATLKLYCVDTVVGVGLIGVHRVQQNPPRDWRENIVTWDSYDEAHQWTTAGGDFNKTPTSPTVVGTLLNPWYSWDVTGDVQDFVTTRGETNIGWIIKNEHGGISPTSFASKEWDNAELRPFLEATYDSSIVVSCDEKGNEVNQFAPGEEVYVRAEGLKANTWYGIWLQDDPVNDGDKLIKEENPKSAETPVEVETDKKGNLKPTLIWSIPEDEPPTHHEYDIVFDKLELAQEYRQKPIYNAASDGLDSASCAGIVAPTPDVSALILFASGLALVSVHFVCGKRRKDKKNKL